MWQHSAELATSSPAVVERSRDASCLSVVSFNNAIFYYYHFGFRFTTAYDTNKCCSVVFGVMLTDFLS